MKILIVDDEKKARETIFHMLKLYYPEENDIMEASDVDGAVEAIHRFAPDLLFLDIRLQNGTGFDVLRKAEGAKLNVIFVTAYEEYAIRAFRISSIDYLLKPLDPDDFAEAFQKAREKTREKKFTERIEMLMHNMQEAPGAGKIALKTSDSIYVVTIADIIFCEADRNYTTFHLLDKRKIMVSKTLGEFEEMLPADSFMRTHQSFLVNLNHIIQYDKKDGGSLLTVNDHNVPVSTRKKEQLMQFLSKL